MDIPSFLFDQDFAGLLITIAGQSLLVSFIGITVIGLLSGKSPPVRSLACAAIILAMGSVATVSIWLRLSGISWSQTTIPISGDTRKTDARMSSLMDIDLPPIFISPVFPATPAIADEIEDVFSGSPNVIQFPLLPLPLSFYINFLGFVWLTGISVQLLKLGYGVILVKNFRRTLKNRDIPFRDMLRTIAGTFWKNRLPALYSSPLIDSPITIGLFKPVVIIPEKLIPALSKNEFKSILLHELAHIYHYDQVIGVLKRIVIAIFWWNPVVYIINREHERAREEVSDNYVLGELSPKVYIQCLMTLAEKVCLISNYPTAAGMAGRRFDLEVRVKKILSKKRDLAIRTRSYLRAMAVSSCLVLTFGIAGLHAHVTIEGLGDTAEKLHKVVSTVAPSQISEEVKSNGPENADSSAVQPSGDTIPGNESDDTPLSIKKNFIVTEVSPADSHFSIGSDPPDNVVSDISVPIETAPDPAIADDNRVSASFREGNDDTALPDYTMATEDIPDQTASCMNRGNMYQRAGRIDDAISTYNRALELNPGNADIYTIRGAAYFSKGAYRKAIHDFNKAISLDPLKAVAYTARGSAYFRLNLLSEAISDYNKAIEINPHLAAAYQNRGSVYYHRGQFDIALQEYNKAIEKNPDLTASYIDRGNIYERWGRIDDAISDYSRALELNPYDAETCIKRGIVYYSQRQYQKAFVDFARAIELDPGFVSAYIYRGYFYQTEKEHDKAFTDYGEGLMSDPNDAVTVELWGGIVQAYVKSQLNKALPD